MKGKEEDYGTPVTLSELEGHYKARFLTPKQFIDLVSEWHNGEVKKILTERGDKH